MTRPHFHEELERLELELLTLGELAGEAVRKSVDAVARHDDEVAEEVIAGDDEVDRLYMDIEQGIVSLLALQAPVAADLRLILAIVHSSLHLERIGDQAVNIAKMGVLARSEVAQAKQAFLLRDVDLAQDLVRQDEAVNKLNRECFQRAVETGDDLDSREWAMTMMLVARALERIGDNAVDIGEQVSFLITGEFREFTDASHPGGVVADGR